jgi:hypothetical protein
MLPCSGFGYNPFFTQFLGYQYLAYGIVYLVSSGVAEVFPLQVNLCVVFF